MIMVDINVLMDAAERREPHFTHAAALIEQVVRGTLDAMIPAHGVTTLYYLLTRARDRAFADRQVSWLLRYFEVGSLNRDGFRQAHAYGWPDFEDAVVAVTALMNGCDAVVTRDVEGFTDSPVRAVHPGELGIDSVHEQIVAHYGT